MRNWAGNVVFSSDDLRRPETLEELQHLVRDARTVRPLGTGHSFSAIADTTGTMVSTQSLRTPVAVDRTRRLAVVPGGATYAEVAAELHRQGWALHNLGSLPHISVAGAVATGTHGSGSTNGCLSSSVAGVELVGADGELLHVMEGHPDFPGMVVALGALGVVTRLWLRIEPTYDVAQRVVLDLRLDDAAQNAEEMLGSAYSVSIFSSFSDPSTLDSVWFKERVDAAAEPPGPQPHTVWGGRPAEQEVHPVLDLDPGPTTAQLGRPGPWHRRLPHFGAESAPSVGDELQSEYLLPRMCAGAALTALRERSSAFVRALHVVEVRTVAADTAWLSPFHERDTVAVHATWVSDFGVARPAIEALEDALSPFDPRPHWGKISLGFDAERIADRYPALPRFKELAGRLDPERCFVNDHLVRLGVVDVA